MDNSEVVDVLNDLVETSKDGEYGFATCAERATSVELKQIFLRRASDCARAASELQAIVVEYGGKAEDSGTVAGAVHRGWVSAKLNDRHRRGVKDPERRLQLGRCNLERRSHH